MDKIKIGKTVNAVGLAGEVKIYSYAGSPERFNTLKRLYIGENEFAVESVRLKGATPIVKLSGVTNRNAAEALRERDVFMAEEDLEELPEGEYYVRDLLGFEVFEEERLVGTLKDILKNGPQDVYAVQTAGGKEILVPGVAEFIKKVDMDAKKIEVKLIEGMEE